MKKLIAPLITFFGLITSNALVGFPPGKYIPYKELGIADFEEAGPSVPSEIHTIMDELDFEPTREDQRSDDIGSLTMSNFGVVVLEMEAPFEAGTFLTQESDTITKGTVLGYYGGEYRVEDLERNSDLSYAVEVSPVILLEEEEYLNLFDEGKYDPDREFVIVIDAIEQGTWTRFINHGGRHHNVEMVIEYRPWPHEDSDYAPVIVVKSTKTIYPGEQLLFDYGENYWERLGFVPSPVAPDTFRLRPRRLRRSTEDSQR